MKAYLVVGPEGSGTYMLWEALASAGCGIDIVERPENYAVRYSLPHAHKWPNFLNVTYLLENKGYEVQPLFILRDWYCTIQSVLRRDNTRELDRIESNMASAFWEMGELAGRYGEPIYITYESFCLHPEFRRWLFCDKLRLPEPDIEIKYANEKYYG